MTRLCLIAIVMCWSIMSGVVAPAGAGQSRVEFVTVEPGTGVRFHLNTRPGDAYDQHPPLLLSRHISAERGRAEAGRLTAALVRESQRVADLERALGEKQAELADLKELYIAVSGKYSVFVATDDPQPEPIMTDRYHLFGRVVEARQAGGETFIAVNIGQNAGVKEDLKLILYKGETFLGEAVIREVGLDASAAIVTLAKGEITVGVKIMIDTSE